MLKLKNTQEISPKFYTRIIQIYIDLRMDIYRHNYKKKNGYVFSRDSLIRRVVFYIEPNSECRSDTFSENPLRKIKASQGFATHNCRCV